MATDRNNSQRYIAYIGVCVALLPVLLLRDFTPSNELRYLSIADEALRNHTFFTFTNQGVPYADKPPLYLWLVMLGKWLLGAHYMWFLSLFSLIPTLITIDVMDKWVASEMDAKGRSLARVLLLTSGLFLGLAVTLRMDMLMCMFIVLSLRVFYRMVTESGPKPRSKDRWLFPVYVFLALFSKGPVGILVPLCSSVVFLLWKRRIREFGRYWGWRTWGVLLAGCLVWFSAVYAEGGNDYLHNLLFHQTIDRAVNSFHHEEPFYYYLISVWYSIAPWSLLIIGLIVAAVCKRLVSTDLQRFFLTVSVTTFVMLSCISSKLQVYLLPAFPFLVYAGVMFLPRFKENGWMKAAIAVPAAVFAVAFPALLFAFSSDSTPPYLRQGLIYAAAFLLTAAGVYALLSLYRKGKGLTWAIHSLAAGLLLAVFVGGWALPDMNPAIGYGALCEKALEVSEAKGISDFRAWRVSRPEGMDVYLKRPVSVLPKDERPSADPQRPAILMVRKRDLEQFSGRETWTVGDYAVVVL